MFRLYALWVSFGAGLLRGPEDPPAPARFNIFETLSSRVNVNILLESASPF